MPASDKAREAGRGYGTPRQFTPSASEAGDAPPQGQPPTYAESMISGHSSTGHRGRTAQSTYSDNKIQVDDEFRGSSPSGSEESLATLDDLAADDETAWALDEEAEAAGLPSYEDATNVPDENELVREIIARQTGHASPTSLPSLPCPIIIPQRRPRQGSKGFVRAYAPILQTVGIDQDTFLSFLRNLHRSTRLNPWFTAVMVSSTTIDTAPSAVAMAVATAMDFEQSTDSTTSRKTNNFLDRMNDELFKPAGCYAFITRYQELADATEQQAGYFGIAAANVDLTTNRVVPKYDSDVNRSSCGRGPSGDINDLTTKLTMFRLTSNLAGVSSVLAPLTFPHANHHDVEGPKDKGPSSPDEKQPLPGPNDSKAGPTETAAQPAAGWFQTIAAGVASLHEHRTQRRAARAERWQHRHERRQERREQRYERHIDRSQRRIDRNINRFENRYGRTPCCTSHTGSRGKDAAADDTPISRTSLGKTSEVLFDHEDRAQDRRTHRQRARQERLESRRTKGMSDGVLYLMIVALPTEQELADARAILQGQ